MFLKKLFSFIPKDDYADALNLYNTGQYARAVKKFRDLRESADASKAVDQSTLDLYTCESHVALGKEYAEAGNIAAAIEELKCAVELKPTFADLHYMLGTFYAQEKRFDAAHGEFLKSLEINNKFFRARVHLSLAMRARGEGEAAAADELQGCRQCCPNFYRETLEQLITAVRSGVSDDEIEKLYGALLEERPSSAQLSKQLAAEAIQNADYDEAIRELKKAIAIKPDYPDLHNYLGIAYGNAEMFDEAVSAFEVALKINPYYQKARLNLALLYYENEHHDEATEQLERVLEVSPDNKLANDLIDELRTVKGGN